MIFGCIKHKIFDTYNIILFQENRNDDNNNSQTHFQIFYITGTLMILHSRRKLKSNLLSGVIESHLSLL